MACFCCVCMCVYVSVGLGLFGWRSECGWGGGVVGIHSQPFKVICMALKLEIQLP